MSSAPPSKAKETTVMTVWPSLAARGDGRMLGRIFETKTLEGVLPLNLSVGKLLAFASIPLVLPLYFFTLLPRVPFVIFGWWNSAAVRYRLTDRRVVVEQAFGGGEQKSLPLGHFDSIDIEVLPGQEWYRAGDLVFKQGPVEKFRLPGIARPEAFRQTCDKARISHAGIAKARDMGAAI